MPLKHFPMKYFFMTALSLLCLVVKAQVKIGNNAGTINAASLFELESTNKGLLIPRLSPGERNGIMNPPTGLLIYNKGTDELNIYNNGAWQSIANSYTFNYATDNAGQTLASNGVNFLANNFLLNRSSHLLVGYLPSDSYTIIDTLMVNGNIRVGKNAPWSSAASDRIIKFGDVSFATIGEQLEDDKLVFRAKNFSFLISDPGYSGNVGIGTAAPNASLHVKRGTAGGGTAAFDGTANNSYFNYSTSEDTYISGGKATSKVIINNVSSGDVNLVTGGGKVGIGTATTNAMLHVARGPATSNTAEFDGTAINSYFNNGPGEHTYISGGKVNSLVIINELSAGDVVIASGGGNVGIGATLPAARLDINGTLKISGGSPGTGKVLTSDANGLASWQAPLSQVNFKGLSALGTNVPNNSITQLIFFGESFDNGNGYNTSTSIFTAPSAGVYYFHVQEAFPISFAGDARLYINVNGITQTYSSSQLSATTLSQTRSVSAMVTLSAGDQVTALALQNSGATVLVGAGGTSLNYFMGYKIN